MSDRYEIERQLKSVVNHTVASRKSLSLALEGMEAMIEGAVSELINERRPSMSIRGFITDTGDVMKITLPAFPLPTLTEYAVSSGIQGLIKLSSLQGSDTLTALGKIIPLTSIPLTESPEYVELSLESVVSDLAKMRLQLCGTGIEG